MSSDPMQQLHSWLKDAHAMEEQAEQMLTAQAKRLEHYPKLQARITQHIDEPKSQAARLEECLESMNTSTSTMWDKDMTWPKLVLQTSHIPSVVTQTTT